jgi:hypothetical protein
MKTEDSFPGYREIFWTLYLNYGVKYDDKFIKMIQWPKMWEKKW